MWRGRGGFARRVAAVAWCAATALALVPGAAAAHPLGVPALVGVSAPDATTVVLRWQAAPDDIGALWRRVGAEVPLGAAPTATQQEAIGAAEGFRDLVATDLAVDRTDCRLVELDATAVTQRGLTATWSCDDAVDGTVPVRVALLTGVDARYRTLVHGSGDPDAPALATATAETVEVPVEVGAPDPTSLTAVDAGGGGDAGAPATDPDSLLVRFEERVLAAIDDRDAGVGALLLALLVALATGALHGLAPGHGKAIAGAYLLGERGRPRHAVALGAIVAGMHTGSTVLLGVVLLSARRGGGTGALESWLALAAGVVVLGLGGVLVIRRLRERSRGAPAARDHQHDHHHPHAHDHEHGTASHTHVVADADPFTLRGLVALGAAGGLLPSPTALLVVITGFATDRLAVALGLVGAFSVGLAATVTAAGLAVLWGRDRVRGASRSHPALQRIAGLLPLAGATAVLCVGAYLTARAATTLLA